MNRIAIVLVITTIVFATGGWAQKPQPQKPDSTSVPPELEILEADTLPAFPLKGFEDRDYRPKLHDVRTESESIAWSEIENDNRNEKVTKGIGWYNKNKKLFRAHWAGYSLEYNGLVSNLFDLHLPENAKYLSLKSTSFSFSFNPVDLAIATGRVVTFATGLGLEFNNFKFDNNMELVSRNGHIAPYYFDQDGVMLQKSKLTTSYLNVPLIVEFRIGHGSDQGFINFGAIGGFRMGGHTKIKANSLTLNGKFKNNDDLHLANFHYGLTLNVGFRNFAITSKYYPTSIFRKDEGPDVQQINVGLGLFW